MRSFALTFFLGVATVQAAEKLNCDPSAGLVDGACLAKKDVYDPCQGGGALDFGECARRAHEKAENNLSIAYGELAALLPDKAAPDALTKDKLRSEEDKWQRWKDSYCSAEGRKNGGAEMWQSAYTVSCWARATEDRVRKLRKLVKEARYPSRPGSK